MGLWPVESEALQEPAAYLSRAIQFEQWCGFFRGSGTTSYLGYQIEQSNIQQAENRTEKATVGI